MICKYFLHIYLLLEENKIFVGFSLKQLLYFTPKACFLSQ